MQGWAWVYSILLTVGGMVRTVLPPDGAFCRGYAKKMHGANGRAVAAAVWHFRHGAAALCHDRLCRGVSFGIGTSTMYLATVHPLLALYAFVGLFLYGRPLKRKETA